MTDRLLTVPEAAARLAYGRAKTFQLIRSGELRAVRHGKGHWRVPESAIGEFIASLESNMDGAA